MGPVLGWFVNGVMMFWTFFECIILCFPVEQPLNKLNMNYVRFLSPSFLSYATPLSLC
jgi:hypothetical protein